MLALGVAASVAGCSTESTAADFSPGTTPALTDNGGGGPFTQKPAEDAAPTKSPPYRGNPLCHVDPSSCMPDDDGYHAPNNTQTTKVCATPPPDAGDASPGADFMSPGCRITNTGPGCFPKAAPSGGDGASCIGGEDCAPGFDCVVGERGTSSCRHYCCAGTCKGNTSVSGSMTFCDVQSLVGGSDRGSLKAPVCMPLKRCAKLLATGECASTETCAVVTEAGDTGCVAIGEKQVGESCDESHCAVTLTCLGQPGTRKCFKLCKVNGSDCPGTQTCATNAAFSKNNSDFGICQ